VNVQRFFGLLVLGAALTLNACGGGTPSAESPTAAPAAQPPTAVGAQPTAARAAGSTQPTPTFERVNDAEPTIAATPQASAALAWRDQVLRNDAVIISISGLPAPEAGQGYAAWLSGKDQSLALGKLSAGANTLALTYVSPTNENLLGAFERIYITRGPEATAATEIKNVVLSGALPEKALIHIRHVLFSIGNTPNKIGFALGLRQEADELLRHAQFLKDAFDNGDFPLVKVHAEHLNNIVKGSEASDLNGDGKVQNPGDGFGLLPNGNQDGYIKGMTDHAKLAAESPDATAAIKLHAGHVQVAGENTRVRVQDILDRATKIAQAGGLADTQQDVLAILALAQQSIQGVDANGDEQIGPTPGEGGILIAYQHAQLMSGIPLTPGEGTVALNPAPPAPTAAPAPQAAPPAAAGAVQVAIGDNSFTPKELSVPVGATVVWTNTGQRKHTVTSDDGWITSGTLEAGATFKQTFDKPGTYAYYCEFHGGKGGQGMAGVITVGDAGQGNANQPPAAPAPPPPAAPQAAAPAPAPATLAVSMKDFEFEPKEIKIKVGTTVIWKNDGAKQHSATAADGSFDTGLFGPGESKGVTFSKAGTFAYYCQLHGTPDGSGMIGTVAVEN
jgi:plastocyanin